MYCCFQETSAAMSFVPGSLAAMLCLPCYCMLLTSRSSRRPAICPLSFSTSARGRKLKSPLGVGSARALDLDPDVYPEQRPPNPVDVVCCCCCFSPGCLWSF